MHFEVDAYNSLWATENTIYRCEEGVCVARDGRPWLWVYQFLGLPGMLPVAEALYSVWARLRLQMTGRPALAEVLDIARRRADGSASCRLPATALRLVAMSSFLVIRVIAFEINRIAMYPSPSPLIQRPG
jgi:hypothetical protein